MCCNDFRKKITVFSITLMLGFFAAEFFRSDEAINVKVSVPIVEESLSLEKVSPVLPQSKRKNCVPADSNLNFRKLAYTDREAEMSDAKLKQIKLRAELASLKANADLLEDSDYETVKKTKNKIKQLEKEIEILEKFLEKPVVSVQMQNLLYVERCSEYGESMKTMPPIKK